MWPCVQTTPVVIEVYTRTTPVLIESYKRTMPVPMGSSRRIRAGAAPDRILTEGALFPDRNEGNARPDRILTKDTSWHSPVEPI